MAKFNYAVRGQEVRDVKTILMVEGERTEVQFKNNAFSTDDAKLAKALDDALAQNLGAYIMKVEISKPQLDAIKAHQEAVKGGLTAAGAKDAENQAAVQIAKELEAAQSTASLLVTEQNKKVQNGDSDDDEIKGQEEKVPVEEKTKIKLGA